MINEQLCFDFLPELPQADFLHQLTPTLWKNPDVMGIWLEGSMGSGHADLYSDVDLYIGIKPEALDTWRVLDIAELFGEQYAAHRTSNFTEEFFVFHVFMTAGHIYDLHIQSQTRELPNAKRLILGCRDESYEADLAMGQERKLYQPQSIEPEAIHTLLVLYWMNVDKSRKLFYRNLDFIIHSGLHIFRHILVRLIYMDYTGKDCGNLTRTGIHGLKHGAEILQEAMGEDLPQLMGRSTMTRLALCEAREEINREVACVGQSLASKYDFDYPYALEQAVLQNWVEFKDEYIILPNLRLPEEESSFTPQTITCYNKNNYSCPT